MARLVDHIADRVRLTETAGRVGEFNHLALIMLLSKGRWSDARAMAERGIPHPTPAAVLGILQKAAVSASDLADIEGFRGLAAAFVDQLKSVSAFDAMLSAMTQVPFQTPIASASTAATGSAVEEGAPKPISRLVLAADTLEKHKTSSIVVVSLDQAKRAPAATMSFIGRELRRATAVATDAAFIAGIRPTGSPDPTITSADPVTDLSALLNAVSLGIDSRPFLIMASDVAKGVATATDTGAGFLFPTMGAIGGTVLGMPAMVSDGMLSGEMMLVDAAAIVAAQEPVRLDIATHAAIAMDSDPQAGATEVVSLWQVDASAIRAERFFGFHVARADVAAVVTGINY